VAPETTAIDVRQFINEHRFSPYQVLILCLCFLCVAVDGFDTAAIGFIAPVIKSDWHLTPAMMSPVFAVALFGLMLGGLIFGPLADKFGRKIVIVISVAIFGVACLVTAAANSVTQLIVLRFITGLGLGGAFANAVTLVSEYSPERRRSSLVMLMVCGFPAGSVLAGVLTSLIEPSFGWRGVLVAGGVLPLALVPFLLWLLPESARYLVEDERNSSRIKRILHKIDPGSDFSRVTFLLNEKKLKKSPIAELFGRELFGGTLLLWVSFFINLMIGYLLISWLPTIVHGFGIPVQIASVISAMFQGGGILGAIVLGWLMDRVRYGHYVVAAAYVADSICVAAIGAHHTVWTLGLAIFAAGFCNTGCQISLNALAAQFYPTANRATGVSWVNAAGRIGAILGASAGGLFLTWQWDRTAIFGTIAVPALIAAAAIFALGRLVARRAESRLITA